MRKHKSLEAVHTHTHTHTNALKNKGITLVALVVTIVVLLILVAISINLVLGQNGLITYAKKASKETKESALKEEVDLALANYELEKIKNKDTTLKEYMENTEKSGLENFKLIDENPSEDVQFIGSIDGRLLIMKTDGSYVLTKSGNLVRNGFGDNGNDNFPDFTNNNGTFYVSTNVRKYCLSSEFIEIDPNKKYYQSIITKMHNKNQSDNIGFIEYDCDENIISDENYLYIPNTLTYLEKDLNDGDTEIHLHDISNFIKEDVGYRNGLIFWNYKDSTGYAYPELTYSRNVYFSLFDESGFDIENNIIKLKNPWNNGKILANTKLSQSERGANHNYGLSPYEANTEFKMTSNIIKGIEYEKTTSTKMFRPGTKYIKIMFWANMRSIEDYGTDIKDIIFAEYE